MQESKFSIIYMQDLAAVKLMSVYYCSEWSLCVAPQARARREGKVRRARERVHRQPAGRAIHGHING